MIGPGSKKSPSPIHPQSGVTVPPAAQDAGPPTASSMDIQAVHQQLRAYNQVAWVLQGGGALGAYQAGVVAGLSQMGIEPTWVAGISSGAIQCALIAGNPAKDRVPAAPFLAVHHAPPYCRDHLGSRSHGSAGYPKPHSRGWLRFRPVELCWKGREVFFSRGPRRFPNNRKEPAITTPRHCVKRC